MQTALITGASRGIGKALAGAFLDAGYVVIGTSTSGTADIEHKHFTVLQLDLSKSDSIGECSRQVGELGKRIDVLINNAGMSVLEEEDETTIIIEYLRRTLEVNLVGTIDFTEHIIPLMNEGGHIINISSRAGSLAYEGYDVHAPAYRISKAGLNMFTRILAKRFGEKMKVSAVHPGWTRTDMGGDDADLSPEEVADDILKLVNADMETGQFWFKGEKFPW